MRQEPQSGAPVVHGSEPGESTPNNVVPLYSVDPRVALRSSIYRAREAAHRRACSFFSYDAGLICNLAAQFAAPWAFNRTASVGQLEQALDVLDHLLRGANALEKLEGRDGK